MRTVRINTRNNLLDSRYVKDFVLGGDAIFTLQSGVTGTYITYKMTRSKKLEDLYFIKTLYGPDNESDYKYIGCYYADTKKFNPQETWKNAPEYTRPKSLRAISYFLAHIEDIPPTLFVYHEGRCGCCGRRLTTPDSIERGIGPECYRRLK